MRVTSRWTKWDLQEDDLQTGTHQDKEGMTGTCQDKEGSFSPSGRVSMRQLRSVLALVPRSTTQTTLRPLENPWGLLTVMLLPTTTFFLRPSFLQGLLLPVTYDCFLQTI